MHEESLVRTLIQQVEELAVKHEAAQVENIEVEIGPLSGVERLLLESAFERLKSCSEFCGRSTLQIHQVELTAKCRECEQEFVMHNFRFVCSECHSSTVQILTGDSMLLRNLQLRVTTG